MMKPLSAAIAAAILAGGVATASAPAQAGPILDAMKKRAQTARGIAKEGSVMLKDKIERKARSARGVAKEASVLVGCKVRKALKSKC